MSDRIKNKIASFAVSLIEKSIFAYFSDIKKNIIQFIDSIADNTSKLYYAYILLIFLIVLAASGVTIITLGVVLIIITLADKSVDHILLAGILLAVTGICYLIGTLSILNIVGRVMHSTISKSSNKMIKKITK